MILTLSMLAGLLVAIAAMVILALWDTRHGEPAQTRLYCQGCRTWQSQAAMVWRDGEPVCRTCAKVAS